MAQDRTITDWMRLGLAAVLAVLLIVFALINTNDTTIDFIIGTATLPLIVVLIGTAIAGAAIAALIRHQRA